MSPKIQHLGHACFKYEWRGVKLVTDPWFFSAFTDAWFPYPDNRGNLGAALDADYIYISHAHEDHFDRKFLREVDPARTTLIIPDFRSHYLERELRDLELGVAYIKLKHGESMTLGRGVTVTMLIDRSHKEDSALLMESSDGFRFLDSNDCELALSDWPKDIDLLACQFSGATWYPQCYSYDQATQAKKAQQVRDNNFNRLAHRVEATEAKAYLPSAGPACFLPPELMQFNRSDGIFPVWEQLDEQFSARFPDVAIWTYFGWPTDIKGYRQRRLSEWSEYYTWPENEVSPEELNEHFRMLQLTNKRWMKDTRYDVYLTQQSREWQIRLGAVAAELEEVVEPSYFMNIPMRVLRAVVDGKISWETALISHRIKLRRNPDRYDLKLMGLLNFGDRPIQTVTMAKQQASDEMTTRDGFEFQRWCPHAGEDMNFAAIQDGKITCIRHEWRWDLNTGECLSGGDIPLKVRKE